MNENASDLLTGQFKSFSFELTFRTTNHMNNYSLNSGNFLHLLFDVKLTNPKCKIFQVF